MIDVHTHTLLSDGEPLPEELVRYAMTLDCTALAITDHVGFSNCAATVAAVKRLCDAYRPALDLKLLAGVEVTHVHPDLIGDAVALAREAGAELVLGHGESLAEPVSPGSNRAYVEAGVDVLAHPGLIDDETAALAAEKGVLLEVSGRKGHCLTNGHVVAAARRTGAALSFGSDAHSPTDLRGRESAVLVLRGAGLDEAEVAQVFQNMERLFDD